MLASRICRRALLQNLRAEACSALRDPICSCTPEDPQSLQFVSTRCHRSSPPHRSQAVPRKAKSPSVTCAHMSTKLAVRVAALLTGSCLAEEARVPIRLLRASTTWTLHSSSAFRISRSSGMILFKLICRFTVARLIMQVVRVLLVCASCAVRSDRATTGASLHR